MFVDSRIYRVLEIMILDKNYFILPSISSVLINIFENQLDLVNFTIIYIPHYYVQVINTMQFCFRNKDDNIGWVYRITN